MNSANILKSFRGAGITDFATDNLMVPAPAQKLDNNLQQTLANRMQESTAEFGQTMGFFNNDIGNLLGMNVGSLAREAVRAFTGEKGTDDEIFRNEIFIQGDKTPSPNRGGQRSAA